MFHRVRSQRLGSRCRHPLVFEVLESRALLSAPDIIYAGPIVITHGGTYSGNWQSLDPNTPAVTIRTAEPVVIANSRISSRSSLIKTRIAHAKLTVRDTSGYGLNADVRGHAPGRFLDAEGFDNIDLENNYLEGTSGIYLLDANVGSGTVRVIANRALNIDGRKSDGQGGFLDFNTRTRLSDGTTEDGSKSVQFLALDKVRHVPGMEVAWNQVINEPGRSRVEDNINIYLSSGTADSPLRIHDNYIQGAYTIKPWQGNYSDGTWNYNWVYSGGGILLGDGKTTDPAKAASFVRAYRNEVVSTTNYGVAIAAGHDNVFFDNRLVSCDRLADGRTIVGDNSGAYIWDSYHTGSRSFSNNSGYGNQVGWTQGTVRRDWWVPNASSWTSNVHMAGPITLDTEAAEFALWQSKLAAAGVTVGPRQP
jgi:hypothetical protein